MLDHYGRGPRRSLRDWIAELGPSNQLALGCVAVLVMGIVSLYCAGTFSILVRPFLFQLAPTPIVSQVTVLPKATLTSTLVLSPLPGGSVPRTPTQGRVPVRDTSTPTPTLDPSISPTITISSTLGTPRASGTPTKFASTPTRR